MQYGCFGRQACPVSCFLEPKTRPLSISGSAMFLRTASFTIVLALVALPSGLAAQDPGSDGVVDIHIEPMEDREVLEDGSVSVFPGDLLSYEVTFENPTDEPVDDVRLSVPLSSGTLVDIRSFDLTHEGAIEVLLREDEGEAHLPLESVLADLEIDLDEVEGDAAVHPFASVRWVLTEPVPAGDVVEGTFIVRIGDS